MSLLWIQAASGSARTAQAHAAVDELPTNVTGEHAPMPKVGTPVEGDEHQEVARVWNSLPVVHLHHVRPTDVPIGPETRYHQESIKPYVVHEKIDQLDRGQRDLPTPRPATREDEHADPVEGSLMLRHNGKHYLIDGHHTFLASRLLGLPTMRARVVDSADMAKCPRCRVHRTCPECEGDPETIGDVF